MRWASAGPSLGTALMGDKDTGQVTLAELEGALCCLRTLGGCRGRRLPCTGHPEPGRDTWPGSTVPASSRRPHLSPHPPYHTESGRKVWARAGERPAGQMSDESTQLPRTLREATATQERRTDPPQKNTLQFWKRGSNSGFGGAWREERAKSPRTAEAEADPRGSCWADCRTQTADRALLPGPQGPQGNSPIQHMSCPQATSRNREPLAPQNAVTERPDVQTSWGKLV